MKIASDRFRKFCIRAFRVEQLLILCRALAWHLNGPVDICRVVALSRNRFLKTESRIFERVPVCAPRFITGLEREKVFTDVHISGRLYVILLPSIRFKDSE